MVQRGTVPNKFTHGAGNQIIAPMPNGSLSLAEYPDAMVRLMHTIAETARV